MYENNDICPKYSYSNRVLPQLLLPCLPYIPLPKGRGLLLPFRDSAAIIEFISSLPDCRYQIPYFYLQKVNFNVVISFLVYLTPSTIEKHPLAARYGYTIRICPQ